ncbi:MAG: hypothetical protein EPN93_19380 [Spirochaetes bacterium]|nr:MAG: hypothetical protein EPN93_19380 [Spirochaetota bacterium]
MSIHEKIDKTRKNIGATGIDDKEKKDLFNRFVDAGGKVINESAKKSMVDFDREKQKQYKAKVETHRERVQSPAPVVRKPKATPASRNASAIAGPGFFQGIWFRLKIRLKLFFLGVTDFYGMTIKPGFLERVNSDYKASLIEIQLLYLDIIKRNPGIGRAVTDDLDSFNPIYLELIEMAAGVFDRTLMNQIVESHVSFPDVAQPVSEFRTSFMALFKKLYVLHSYRDFIIYAFEKAINTQAKLEKKKAGEYSTKKKKINNSVALVYYRLFNALYWLMCHYAGTVIPLADPGMERFLGIAEEDKPGKRKKHILAQAAAAKKEQEEDENTGEAKEAAISEETKIGLKMMSRLDLKDLQAKFEVEKHFKVIHGTDKVLIIFLLFREFDEEYSFILTTNKIKYNVVFSPEGKIDFRVQLSDLYKDLRTCMSLFKDYAEIMETYERTRTERPASNAQYIDYSKRIEELEKKRNNSGKNLRGSVSSFMEKCSIEFVRLMEDMNGPQKIIDNPQDELVFEQAIEGAKKVNGQKVYEAIKVAFCYIQAFQYRLGPEGDLSGALDFKEGQNPQLSPQQDEPGEAADEKPKSNPEKDKEESDSVIRELDDLV